MDVLLMVVVMLLLDHVGDLAEHPEPRFPRLAQGAPMLPIHNGVVLERNLCRERLTEQELAGNLRKQGVRDVARVKQAVPEADGQSSVEEKG